MTLQLLRQKGHLADAVAEWKSAGQNVGVVPTMGALHAGHLSLVQAAKAACDRVIVTIFVNPKQFNNPGDLATYPRTEHEDTGKLAPYGVDLIYVPDPDQVYPAGFSTNVSVAGISEGLCGAHRPGHFDGVATVVAKLFLQTGADQAFFGEKDYQQLMLVQRLARDLDIPTQVIGCPTVRESDGLALSSRNLRLSDAARTIAPALHRAMRGAAGAIASGADVAKSIAGACQAVVEAGYDDVEYMELRAEGSLERLSAYSGPARLMAAANLNGVRLIDNVALGSP